MSILTSLLIFLSGLALIIVLLKARPKSRARRIEDWEESKMELGAKICEVAARDAFDVELDHSDASLRALDEMVANGWSSRPLEPRENDTAVSDTLFVLSSYFGDVLVKHHGAVWKMDNKTHRWPYLFFKGAELAASPFDIVEKKLAEPVTFSLENAHQRLLAEVERRKNMRATSWHASHEAPASFAPSEQTNGELPHAEIHNSVPHDLTAAYDPPRSDGDAAAKDIPQTQIDSDEPTAH